MTNKTDENPFPRFATDATDGERYGGAVNVNADQASHYMDRLIEWEVTKSGIPPEESRKNQLSNLAYHVTSMGDEARTHVEKVFGAVHPVFGGARPDPAAAFAQGQADYLKMTGIKPH